MMVKSFKAGAAFGAAFGAGFWAGMLFFSNADDAARLVARRAVRP